MPGSENPLGVLEDEALIDWLRTAAPNCEWTASVCSGAGLYAVAGLLEGKATNTHWGFRDYLRALGVTVVEERVVWDGTHISCAGVSAGIDMALALTERVHGRELAEALQLVIEYDPEPPLDSGSVAKASTKTRRLATRIMLGGRPVRAAAKFSAEIARARMRRARDTVPARDIAARSRGQPAGASPYGAGPPFGLVAARRCQTSRVSACSRAKLPNELDNRFGSLGG